MQIHILAERKKDLQIWRDAWNKAGGLHLNPFRIFSLGGFVKLYLYLLAGCVVLFLVSGLLGGVFNFFANVFNAIKYIFGCFFLAWPRTLKYTGMAFKHWNLFRHFGSFWPFIPELFLGILIPVKRIKKLSYSPYAYDFEGPNLPLCMLPFIVIELLHFATLNKTLMNFTFFGALFRGFGLGTGVVIIVWAGHKIQSFVSGDRSH